MRQAVVAGAVVVAALNLVPAVVGGAVWYRGRPDGSAARAFWVTLRVGQGAALAFALVVGSLAAAGHTASEGLFYLYALLPLAVAFVAEQLRVASAQTILDQSGLPDSASVGRLPEDDQRTLVGSILRREIGVMAISAVVVVFLALRAAGTAHGF
ncbi:MAG TPA: hypothetical protein VKG82_02495 [Solirubrobacteraceae bacterium]|nr:hypothetical protein [Solirubrobacteraceae bacterium]